MRPVSRNGDLDLIVVGAGITGLSAALAARDRGLRVRCLEAARPGAGQSAGRTRIFRHRHAELRLVQMAARARGGWDRWEERLGRKLVGDEGALVAAPDLEAHARRFDEAGVEYAELDREGQRRTLPAATALGESALFDRRGGAIRAAAAVDGLSGLLGEAIAPAEVLGLVPERRGVEVHASEGIWRARSALLCAGSATEALARPVGIELPVRHGCVLRGAFRVRGGERLACLLDGLGGAYGSQCEGEPLYAVGLHSSEVALSGGSASIPPPESLGGALESTSRYVADVLPGLDPEAAEQRLCRTTRLPWSDDGFAAWRRGPVTAFAGNNVFKFAPLLGPLLVDAATSDAVPAELRPPA